MKEHYSPGEFAELAGVSKQNIYKLMNEGLSEYVVVVAGKKRILAKALEDYAPKNYPRKHKSSIVNIESTNENIETTRNNIENNINQEESSNNNNNQEETTADQVKSPDLEQPSSSKTDENQTIHELLELLKQEMEERKEEYNKRLADKDREIERLKSDVQYFKDQLEINQKEKDQLLITVRESHALQWQQKQDQEDATEQAETKEAQDTTTAANPEPVRQDPPQPQKKRSWIQRLFG